MTKNGYRVPLKATTEALAAHHHWKKLSSVTDVPLEEIIALHKKEKDGCLIMDERVVARWDPTPEGKGKGTNDGIYYADNYYAHHSCLGGATRGSTR